MKVLLAGTCTKFLSFECIKVSDFSLVLNQESSKAFSDSVLCVLCVFKITEHFNYNTKFKSNYLEVKHGSET